LATLKVEYEAKLKDLHASYPLVIAKRLAHALLRAGDGTTIGELLTRADADPLFEPIAGAVAVAEGVEVAGRDAGAALAQPTPTTGAAPAATATLPATATATATAVEDDALVMQPYIETDRCTTCNECTNLNNRMFAYNANKQAYIKDPKAGTFAHLVQAAEKCPAALIHPGTPLNPKEKDVAKWLKRAEPFN
jgi:pyruvate-ferredoxin/flavodoxin oxidoreductase